MTLPLPKELWRPARFVVHCSLCDRAALVDPVWTPENEAVVGVPPSWFLLDIAGRHYLAHNEACAAAIATQLIDGMAAGDVLSVARPQDIMVEETK